MTSPAKDKSQHTAQTYKTIINSFVGLKKRILLPDSVKSISIPKAKYIRIKQQDKTQVGQQAEALELIRSGRTIHRPLLKLAFWLMGIGFFSLSFLPFIHQPLMLMSILLMLCGSISGIASSFTKGGRAAGYLRKSRQAANKRNFSQALYHLKRAHQIYPSSAIQEDIARIEKLLA